MEEILWPAFILGVLVATLGWMIYWAGINVIGAFVGAGAGVALAGLITNFFSLTRYGPLISMGGLVVGIFGGMYLMRALNYYAFFIIGVMLGASVGTSFLNLSIFDDQEWATTDRALIISTVVGALTGGIVLLMFRRYVIAVVAAVAGSMLIAVSFPEGHRDLIGVLSFAGSVVIQFLLIRSFLPEERMNLLAVERQPRKK